MAQDPTAPSTTRASDTPGDARLSAPAALRNREAILYELMRFAPARGRALELASGTGEHVIRFAAATPGLIWHPTEPDAARRASIAAWIAASGLANVLPPRPLDAARPGWGAEETPYDLVFVANLLHLVPRSTAEAVLAGMADALAPRGVALIYGPFLRDGDTTSEGDARFHESLQAQDPAIGYKDVAWVAEQMVGAGLRLIETVRMPANNLLLAFERV